MIDVTALKYSDAIEYRNDYLSTNPIYNITDEEFHLISATYGLDCGSFNLMKRFKI